MTTPLEREIQLTRHRLDDADIGLVRDQPVDVLATEFVGGERFVDRFAERGDGHLEHFAPDIVIDISGCLSGKPFDTPLAQ